MSGYTAFSFLHNVFTYYVIYSLKPRAGTELKETYYEILIISLLKTIDFCHCFKKSQDITPLFCARFCCRYLHITLRKQLKVSLSVLSVRVCVSCADFFRVKWF